MAIAFALGSQERAQQPAFEILYDANDPRFVRPLNGGFQYFVCLHILANRSIRAPNIRVLESEFTKKVFAPDHYPKDGPYLQRTVQLYSGGQLDPDDREFIWLCDLPDYEYLKPDYERSPLLTVQRFTLEARGENARVVRAEFEYDPDKKPMIRKLSGQPVGPIR